MDRRRKVSFLGIIVGSIVSVVGRQIALAVIGVFIGVSSASVAGAPANSGALSPWVVFITILVMALFSMLGGYTAAYIAQRDELLNGVLSSYLALILTACSISADPFYLSILTLLISPSFALLGGNLRLKQMAQQAML